jgi:hypothetical protein
MFPAFHASKNARTISTFPDTTAIIRTGWTGRKAGANFRTSVYMTFLGKAVFTPEFAAHRLGIEHATSLAYYKVDDISLRRLAEGFPRVRLLQA